MVAGVTYRRARCTRLQFQPIIPHQGYLSQSSVMLRLGAVALLLVFFPAALSETCAVCKTKYATAKSDAGSDNGQKCTALSAYLTCLETSAKDDDGCPLPSADTDAIEADYTDASCSSSFNDTCICQKTFWKTVQTDDTATCRVAKVYLTCMKGKTAMACDGTSSVATLTAGVETRMKALSGCTISPPCQCEINVMKADMSTDLKKCTAYKTQFSCLYGLSTGDTCDPGTNLADLKTDAAASVTGVTSCTFDDTCSCQRSYDAAAKSNDAEKCTARKAELSCLGTAKASTGCDGSTSKSAIATASENARAALTNASAADCPAPSSTCQCQITAAKEDNSDSTNYCRMLGDLKTCLSAITTPTEAGCTSTTQASLLASTTEMHTTAMCAADHVTFVMTSLLASLFASMFL
ncbi:pneumococcal serine-rich repeat protein-like [Haliotis cracherodii]|uniref:pneumococcal serine-rich repeat protein-like n=1 Tax=Haliotis cracherodii TaxID=6455 RepID=UPI0039EA906E